MRKTNADYFKHVSNLRNDRKIKALRSKYSHLGYCIYMYMMEALAESDGFMMDFSENEREFIAGDFMVSVEDLETITDYCIKIGLFQITEDGFIFSQNLTNSFEDLVNEREKKSVSGKKGAETRWVKNDGTAIKNDGTAIKNDGGAIKNDGGAIQKTQKTEKKIANKSRVDKSRVEKKIKTDVFTKKDFFESVSQSGFSEKEKTETGQDTQTETPQPANDPSKTTPEEVKAAWDVTAAGYMLPKAPNVTKESKLEKALNEFCNTPNSAENLKRIFSKVRTSEFLQGKNSSNWVITFHWLFADPDHWQNVMEGKYDPIRLQQMQAYMAKEAEERRKEQRKQAEKVALEEQRQQEARKDFEERRKHDPNMITYPEYTQMTGNGDYAAYMAAKERKSEIEQETGRSFTWQEFVKLETEQEAAK